MTKIKPATVDEYIDAAPPQSQKMLQVLRKILKEVVPTAREVIKWGNPVMEEKRILFSYAAFRSHLNFMPTHSALIPFEKELSDYTTGKDTIQFSYNKPLPEELIRRIAAYRAKQVMEDDELWMTGRNKKL